MEEFNDYMVVEFFKEGKRLQYCRLVEYSLMMQKIHKLNITDTRKGIVLVGVFPTKKEAIDYIIEQGKNIAQYSYLLDMNGNLIAL